MFFLCLYSIAFFFYLFLSCFFHLLLCLSWRLCPHSAPLLHLPPLDGKWLFLSACGSVIPHSHSPQSLFFELSLSGLLIVHLCGMKPEEYLMEVLTSHIKIKNISTRKFRFSCHIMVFSRLVFSYSTLILNYAFKKNSHP